MATESRESTACESGGGGGDQGVWGVLRWKMLLKSFRIDHAGDCVPDLLDSERGADLLSSEDDGALRQDFGQLEGIQAQQLAGVGDHWAARQGEA